MEFGTLYACMPVCPRAARFVFAGTTDQGQPEGAKGVVLHLLLTSPATPFGVGILQPLRVRAPARACRKDQVKSIWVFCAIQVKKLTFFCLPVQFMVRHSMIGFVDLKQRHFLPPTEHSFLFGPRGTGKSTWLRACLPGAYIVDLLDDATWRQYLSNPDHIKAVVKANPEFTCFIIDEVQKAPKILDSIHALIEENRGFVATIRRPVRCFCIGAKTN